MDIRKLLGFNLTRLRAKRTQLEVSEACGFETGSLSRWENGKSWASSETIETLAKYYQVDVSELYRAEKDLEPLRMPISETLHRLSCIPDYIYDLAFQVPIDSEAWLAVKVSLKVAIKKQEIQKAAKVQG
jgi:transcriptional regulator with XRE-family HTH domain